MDMHSEAVAEVAGGMDSSLMVEVAGILTGFELEDMRCTVDRTIRTRRNVPPYGRENRQNNSCSQDLQIRPRMGA